MKSSRAVLVALLAGAGLALGACASPTLFQPAPGPGAMGYSEFQIEPGRWRVTFQGGGGAPATEVSDYALLRAAQITLRDGDDWFEVTDRYGAVTGGGGGALSIGGGGASFGRGGGVGLGVGTSFPLGGGPALSQTIEFIEGKGARPPAPAYYDARGVAAQIGPRAGPGPAG